jgi:zinc protease
MTAEILRSATSRLPRAVAVAAVYVGIIASSAAAEMKLPPVERTVLSNGMVLLVMEDARLPLVNFNMAIWGGSASDPAGLEGVADLTATLVRKGAGGRSAGEIAEAVEFMGGSLDSHAERDFTVFTAEFLAKDMEKGLDLLGDVVLKPSFDGEEFEREKAKALGKLEQIPDDPYELADREFAMFLLGHHPYAHPTTGTLSSVEAIARTDVTDFHNRFYRPQRAVMAVVGDVDPAKALEAVRSVFGTWVPEGEGPVLPAAPEGEPGRRVLLIDKPDATQTQIRIGNVALSRTDKDYIPLTVLNVLFGGGFTSRLIDEIRVNRGLSYSPHSRLYSMAGGGMFVIEEYTRNEQAMETVEVTLDLVKDLRDLPIPEDELAKTKSYITGLFPLRLERPESMARQLVEIELYHLGEDYLYRYSEMVDGVTADELSRVARKYIGYDDLTLVIVGVADQLTGPLSQFGSVEVRTINAAQN